MSQKQEKEEYEARAIILEIIKKALHKVNPNWRLEIDPGEGYWRRLVTVDGEDIWNDDFEGPGNVSDFDLVTARYSPVKIWSSVRRDMKDKIIAVEYMQLSTSGGVLQIKIDGQVLGREDEIHIPLGDDDLIEQLTAFFEQATIFSQTYLDAKFAKDNLAEILKPPDITKKLSKNLQKLLGKVTKKG